MGWSPAQRYSLREIFVDDMRETWGRMSWREHVIVVSLRLQVVWSSAGKHFPRTTILFAKHTMENGTSEAKDPSGFLSEIIGAPVTVKLNSGVVYKGECWGRDSHL